MILVVAILLLLFWGAGLVADIAGGIIHILLVLALVAFVYHFLKGKRGA